MSHYLAFDLGAESGRAMLGKLAGGRLELEELHRFPNQPVRLPDGLGAKAVRLLVAGTTPEFAAAGGSLEVTVPSIAAHEVVAVDV